MCAQIPDSQQTVLQKRGSNSSDNKCVISPLVFCSRCGESPAFAKPLVVVGNFIEDATNWQ